MDLRKQTYQQSEAAEAPQISGIVWLWFVLVPIDLNLIILLIILLCRPCYSAVLSSYLNNSLCAWTWSLLLSLNPSAV